ncbi:hypothetical protein SAMN05421827_10993 [Pedobacter terrae]|uniref:Uncharacterized protein n=1 Tax=Pedobacter terrae TaxID=405671 RepID=A0A1G7W453_9SPHI|nr:hypothetical protein SAMN05421827_10993 [Pedobacter terrae]
MKKPAYNTGFASGGLTYKLGASNKLSNKLKILRSKTRQNQSFRML